MQFSAQQTYAAPPERIHSLLTDERFLASVATQMGAVEHKVAASATRTAVEATVESPSEVRALVGATLVLTQETMWGDAAADGSRFGTVTITVAGTPASASGVVHLAPEGTGSSLAYEGELTVKIPLVGPAIEKAAAPAIDDALQAQERAARNWLRDNPA